MYFILIAIGLHLVSVHAQTWINLGAANLMPERSDNLTIGVGTGACSSIVHFAVAGIFTYLYARQMRLSCTAALLSSFIFVFGAASGGAYYNMPSLKVFSWFPFMLLFFEAYLTNNKRRNLFLVAVGIAFSLLAGYQQVAVFSLIIFYFYIALRLFLFRQSNEGHGFVFLRIAMILVATVGAFLITSPQIYLMFKLSMMSNRVGLTESYTYIGSMSPFAVLTFLFPAIQYVFKANCLYIGVLPLVFVLFSGIDRNSRKTTLFRLWICITTVSFLIALGKWGFIYPALIKTSHFYSFRFPSKFVVFCVFGLSILSGLGYQQLFEAKPIDDSKTNRSVARACLAAIILIVILFSGYLAANSILTFGQPAVFNAGQWFVEHYIYGKIGHPHSLAKYFNDLITVIQFTQNSISPVRCWNLWAFVMILSGLYFLLWLHRKGANDRHLHLLGICLILLDLYAYSWIDFRLDMDTYQHALKSDPIISTLIAEKQSGALTRLYGMRPYGKTLPLVPSANMLYDIEDIGIYSPLVIGRYHETIGMFGNINDSNFSYSPTPEFVKNKFKILNFLNVSHVMSAFPLKQRELRLIDREVASGIYLYRNTDEHHLGYVISNVRWFDDWNSLKETFMETGFDPSRTLLIEKSEGMKIADKDRDRVLSSLPVRQAGPHVFSGDPELLDSRLPRKSWARPFLSPGKHSGMTESGIPDAIKKQDESIQLIYRADDFEEWEIQINQPAFFVTSEAYDSGWKTWVNGREVPLLKAHGLFRAVWIDSAGVYKIKFRYQPFSID